MFWDPTAWEPGGVYNDLSHHLNVKPAHLALPFLKVIFAPGTGLPSRSVTCMFVCLSDLDFDLAWRLV